MNRAAARKLLPRLLKILLVNQDLLIGESYVSFRLGFTKDLCKLGLLVARRKIKEAK